MYHLELSTAKRLLARAITLIVLLGPGSMNIAVAAQGNGAFGTTNGRAVTVADTIRMSQLVGNGGQPARFSHDGKKFIIVVRKGNVEHNTNEYSLLLDKTEEVMRGLAPDTLLTLSSSSNREAIADVRWMPDDSTITFLGENPGESRQLYSLNVDTHTLKRITAHSTSILYYSMGSEAKSFSYVAEGAQQPLLNSVTQREGVLVSTQRLSALLGGQAGLGDFNDNQLFYSDPSGTREIHVAGKIATFGQLALSPDGQYLIAQTHMQAFPDSWRGYANPLIKEFSGQHLAAGQFSFITKYVLVRTKTGETCPFLDTPAGTLPTSIVWAPDSRSVVMAGVYLPLERVDAGERELRAAHTFVVEVRIANNQIVKIAQEDEIRQSLSEYSSRETSWDPGTNLFTYRLRDEGTAAALKLVFEKQGELWRKVRRLDHDRILPEIVLQEDINSPPKLFAIDPISQKKVLLLDLNPQLKELGFGRVEKISWKAADGHEVSGGLYYPIHYVAGNKYPLVIQTHGWNPNKFWVDGPFTTAFAAQPLAGRDIMVLQADEVWGGSDFDTPKEFDREVSTFEGGIDELDRRGLVDRDRVGIIGFSRTGTFVAFALTRPNCKFAAASVADGSTFGPFDFLLVANSSAEAAATVRRFYGGLPFGDSLKPWIDLSPQFNLDKVQTPIRLLATGPDFLLMHWDWFTSLLALHKPVEMVYLPDGMHVLQKPWERMVSQQGNVDWFAFWLKGEEDSDAGKADQYLRWRQMRSRNP